MRFTPFQFTTHVFLPLLINAFNKFANYSIRVRLEEANKQRGENYWIYIWKFIERLLMVDVVWRGVGVPATNYTGNVWIAAASINWILMLPRFPFFKLQTSHPHKFNQVASHEQLYYCDSTRSMLGRIECSNSIWRLNSIGIIEFNHRICMSLKSNDAIEEKLRIDRCAINCQRQHRLFLVEVTKIDPLLLIVN